MLNDPRKGLAHLAIPTDQPLVLSASSDGRVAGFSSAASSNNSTATYGVPPSFEARLSTAVNRLVHANVRPRYKQPRPECVLDRDIIGTSLDGAMFSFSILEDNGYLLLKLIENMCHRNTRICPLASAAERQTPLEADRERPQDLSINGDLLKVLIGRRDAETVLRDMLDAPLVPGYYGSRQRDFERVEDRRRAVKLLLKGLEKQIPVAALTAEQTSFERRILDYMRQALEDPF